MKDETKDGDANRAAGDGPATVTCAQCGKVIPKVKALIDEWYGKRAYVCSRDCQAAREHGLTEERDDESVG
jgi:ribosomal protein S26